MAEPYVIKMPQLSDTMTEGVVVSWEKAVGDKIERGDIVATVETDKAIMDVEVFVPEAFMGDVIGDLNARGGKIESINAKMGIHVIKAAVPLSSMFGYSTDLRSATQGRGTFSMQFSHFDRP